QRWIQEIEIDPLEVAPGSLWAGRARIRLHDPSVSEESLPRLSIRPYPEQYVSPWKLKDGIDVLIRPIRPEDEPLMVTFHESLSDDTVYLRYLHMLKLSERISHSRLAQICFPDYDREMVLVAERIVPEGTDRGEILGVGRLTKLHGRNEAEFAILIRDDYQGRGLGTELLSRLVNIGHDEKLDRIVADILPENRGMIAVSRKVGFDVRWSPVRGTYRAILDL
ncbi:MAG TPA: GNAT family N-acetyltransferase, partial [Acidobacteriota bacterium]|nr:GNAT family N-acetyltransferase [Acidobacteriota bacterium]